MAVLVLAVVATTVALGELASNTAMAAILAPLLIEAGPRYAGALGADGSTAAAFLAVVVGTAASFGFALPVATPPNAIVFATGLMDKDHMLRAGAVLDAVMAVVVTLVLLALFRFAWPLALSRLTDRWRCPDSPTAGVASAVDPRSRDPPPVTGTARRTASESRR